MEIHITQKKKKSSWVTLKSLGTFPPSVSLPLLSLLSSLVHSQSAACLLLLSHQHEKLGPSPSHPHPTSPHGGTSGQGPHSQHPMAELETKCLDKEQKPKKHSGRQSIASNISIFFWLMFNKHQYSLKR